MSGHEGLGQAEDLSKIVTSPQEKKMCQNKRKEGAASRWFFSALATYPSSAQGAVKPSLGFDSNNPKTLPSFGKPCRAWRKTKKRALMTSSLQNGRSRRI